MIVSYEGSGAADVRILVGDCREVLATLPAESVDCVATSPPFFGLRDYGTGTWEGGDEGCDHAKVADPVAAVATSTLGGGKKTTGHLQEGYRDVCGKCGARRVDRQIGLEATPEEWAAELVAVFAECRRVLRPAGSLWIECGDSFASTPKGNPGALSAGLTNMGRNAAAANAHRTRSTVVGDLKPKDLIGQPFLLAFALRADGWYWRGCYPWAKPNAMPESAKDRCTSSHSYVLHFAKRSRYFFDGDAIAEPAAWERWGDQTVPKHEGTATASGWVQPKTKDELRRGVAKANGTSPLESGRSGTIIDGRAIGGSAENASKHPRSVWTIPTRGFPGAHFACVDDETEALTQQGWKRQDELQDGESIASYDPGTNSVRFLRAEFVRYHSAGELVASETRGASQRLTPNHRCVVRRRDSEEEVVHAEDLRPGMSVKTYARIERGRWGKPLGPLAGLLGWYIGEGWRRAEGRAIYLTQSESANPQHVRRIRELLLEANAEFVERVRERPPALGWHWRTMVEWKVGGHVGDRLRELAPEKRMTADLALLADEDAESLLDALIDADGHRRADGRASIIQKDRESIEWMQVLGMRCGYNAHLSQREDGMFTLHLTRAEWLTLRGTGGKHDAIPREHYKGTVWCPRTPTGFWLARRDGKTFITGNTWPEALAERIILAGCPKRVCGTCGKPSERIAGDSVRTDSRPGYSVKLSEITDGNAAQTGRAGDYVRETVGWSDCGHGNWTPGVILDPFGGSGTTGVVARRLGRHAILIELNEDYAAMAAKRVANWWRAPAREREADPAQTSLLAEPGAA